MQFKDYYRILGVAPAASQDEIKAAYRKLARTLHPDVNKAADAQKRFVEVGEAYEALGDPEKRKAYDELRASGWKEGQEFDAPPPGPRGSYRRSAAAGDGGDPFAGMDADQFSDFFSSLFGSRAGGRGRRGPVRARGEDLHHRIDLTVEELFRGGERQLQLQLPDGAGGPTTRTLTVKIPPGLAEGEPIRLRGQGMPGSGGEPAGDLYLEAAVAPHPFYRLDGRDVLVDLPLAPWEAALGAQVPAPTLGGTLTVTIPPGAQDGQKLRLRGRGLPGDPAGDQYLVLRIAMPPAADAAAKTLWRQLAAAAPFNPRAKLGV